MARGVRNGRRRLHFVFIMMYLRSNLCWRTMTWRLHRVFICLFVCASCLSVAQAQQPAGASAITLDVREISLRELLDILEEQSHVTFAISKKDLDQAPPITLQVERQALSEVLTILRERYGYQCQKIGNTISVKHIQEPAPASTTDDDAHTSVRRKVSGAIIDAVTSEPLVGASIFVKGMTHIGTIADVEGRFTLTVPAEAKALLASFVGYETKETPLYDATTLTIALTPSSSALEEVVVVGYGTQKEVNVTGAISTLPNDQFKDFPVRSFDQALSGQVAGVQINENTGAPGKSASIDIRGIGTLTAGKQPLIVVDGLPISTENSNINFINPAEIEDITILKDASSASIYGSRAANGVILITTKKGRTGKTEFTLDTYQGIQEVTKKIDVMNAYERANFVATARNNSWVEADPDNNSASDANSIRTSSTRIPDEFMPYIEGEKGLTDTDWQDEIFRPAYMGNYVLSAAGGSEQLNYFVSLGYFDQEGIVVNSDFKRYSLRTNVEAKLAPKLKLTVNLAPTFATSDLVSEDDHKGDGVIFSSLLANPIMAARNEDGSLNIGDQITTADEWGLVPNENPLALALVPEHTFDRARFIGGLSLQYELLEGLTLKTYFGSDFTYSHEKYFRPSTLGSYGVEAPNDAEGTDDTETNMNWVFENTAQYQRTFSDAHHITFLAGMSLQRESDEYNNTTGVDYPNDFVTTISAALETTGYTYRSKRALASGFSRLSYDYQNKYMANLSLRRDGYSAFGDGSKWGLFPAASAGWRIRQEPWMASQQLFSELKLRVSWGIAGNNQIPDFGGLALLQASNAVLDNDVQAGFSQYSSPNDNLSWEETETIDIGIDVGLWQDHITLTADVFKAVTDGLLLDVPVPAHSGFSESLQNIGKIQNQGIELTLGYQNQWGPVSLRTSFNVSTAQNKVLSLGPDQEIISELIHITEIGKPLGCYYGYKVEGVFQTEEQLNSTPHDEDAAVGSYIYADIDDDGEITDSDRTTLGNFFPDYTYGLNTTLGYKNFDLKFLLQGKQGYEILNGLSFFLLNEQGWCNGSTRLLNNYFVASGDADNGKYAKPRQTPTDKLYEKSDLMIEDGSYLRLRNVSIGYTFPKVLLNKISLHAVRVYVSVNNLYTWTNYSGYNPEVTSNNKSWNESPTTPGVDYGAYPLARTYVAGLNLKF